MERPLAFDLVSEDASDGVRVVRVRGDVDLATCATVEQAVGDAIVEDGGRAVVLDLSDCGFIDSSGIGVLVRAAQAAEAAGRGLVVVATGHRVLRSLDITGAASALRLAASADDALAQARRI